MTSIQFWSIVSFEAPERSESETVTVVVSGLPSFRIDWLKFAGPSSCPCVNSTKPLQSEGPDTGVPFTITVVRWRRLGLNAVAFSARSLTLTDAVEVVVETPGVATTKSRVEVAAQSFGGGVLQAKRTRSSYQ